MFKRLGLLVVVAMLSACTGAIDDGPAGADDPTGPGNKDDNPDNMTLPDGGTIDDNDDDTVTDPDVGFDPPEGTYTHSWYGDVGPLLIEQCGACHQAGASGPFSMTYGNAYTWRALIKSSTATRSMPPMPVNGDGSCQTFTNARWLSPEEIAMIGAWVDEGAPKGKPAAMPSNPKLLSITNPNTVISMPAAFTPKSGALDEYRCFPVKSGSNVDVMLTAYDVIPGAPSIDHHMILYLEPNNNNNYATTEDAKDAEPGYPCDVTIGGPNGQTALPLAVWAPGGGRIEFPAGTGVRIPANRTMVIQMHYNLAKGPVSDLTKINMTTVPVGSVKEAMFFPVADMNLNAPAGETHFMDPAGTTPVLANMAIYGVFPHMHTKGKTMRATYHNAGTGDQCLVDVDRWDFRWQEGWWYPKPIAVEGNVLTSGLGLTNFTIQCGFDTTSTNEVTHWGENTADEMCLNFIYITSPDLAGLLTALGI